MVKVDYRS